MSLHLFAGIAVSDLEAATAWHERLWGAPPSMRPNDTEVVWQLADHGSVFLRLASGAGHSEVALFIDDPAQLDLRLRGIEKRGISPDLVEAYDNGVRKVTYRDPDGNQIGFASGQ